MTLSDCTADLVGQLNGNGQKGMLQIDGGVAISYVLPVTRTTSCLRMTATSRQSLGVTVAAQSPVQVLRWGCGAQAPQTVASPQI